METDKELPKNEAWSQLTDTQKTQLLFGSNRLLDGDIFLSEFKSWEQPEYSNEAKTSLNS